MKTLKTSGFAVGANMIRPLVFYTMDKWARRLLVVGEVFSAEVQHQYAIGVLEGMIEDELKKLLDGIVVPSKLEALKRKARKVATFSGPKKEWHVFGSIRELKRRILRAMLSHEGLYNFYDSHHRDLFWQEFSDKNQFRRLMGLLIVYRQILFTKEERTRFISNLGNRLEYLYS